MSHESLQIPMILIVCSQDRSTAAQKLHGAPASYEMTGPITNIEFLKGVCGHPDLGRMEWMAYCAKAD